MPPSPPPEEKAENEEVSCATRDELETHEEDLGDEVLEPDALRSENVIVLPEPPGRTKLGRLC